MLLANDLHLFTMVVRQAQLVVAAVIQGFDKRHDVLSAVRTFMDVHARQILQSAR